MTYIEAIQHILCYGTDELNQRTGKITRRAFGLSVEYNDGKIFSNREVYPHISAAELAWMVSGKRETTWLKKYTKIWDKFEDRPDFIENAYGWRWRHAQGRDQLLEAIELLRKDRSSRQALVMAWDPMLDGLANQGKVKNVPCPFAFNLFIIHDKLKVIVYQRSADFIAGVPYDLMTYWYLGQMVANELDCFFSGVNILFGDAHIYHDHLSVARMMAVKSLPRGPHIPVLLSGNLNYVTGHADDFVSFQKGLWTGMFPIIAKVEVAQ